MFAPMTLTFDLLPGT